MNLAEAQVWYGEASSKLAARDVNSALAFFSVAESLGWNSDDCSAGRWECYMLLGDFEAAWYESELIVQRGAPDRHRLWDGQPFTGRKVMLRCLHGLGDAIQFIRYAPLVQAQAKTLSVEVPGRLMSLISTCSPIQEVISWEAPRDFEPEWDQQIEIMELPRAFRTTMNDIPRPGACLSLDAETATRFLQRWKIEGDKKVGLAWAGGTWDPSRSLPLQALRPILQRPDVSFYSLQAGPEQGQLAHLPKGSRVTDLVDAAISPLETAAQISKLDLVITVDTMVAHLAGALGKPVWLMLCFASDWRWMLHRADSPWYPSMRIFRQSRPDDWDSVVRQVDVALQAFCSDGLRRDAAAASG